MKNKLASSPTRAVLGADLPELILLTTFAGKNPNMLMRDLIFSLML